VIISMPGATARRERIARYFAASPIPWRFEDASDGSDSVLPYDPKRARRQMGRELKTSEIGVFQSNIKLLRKFVEQGEGFLLCCEDDVFVDFEFDFQALLRAMTEAGVDYMRLYSRRVAPARHLVFWRNRWLVRYLWEPFGMQAYLINVAGAARLLERLAVIARPIDDELDRFWENGFPLYSLFPHPVLELSSPSSILRTPTREPRFDVLRYKARRALDRLLAVARGGRNRRTDVRFAAALRATDAG
jgi:GR25 family glycosyltransferase involved in LPS biosynthesis